MGKGGMSGVAKCWKWKSLRVEEQYTRMGSNAILPSHLMISPNPPHRYLYLTILSPRSMKIREFLHSTE